MGVVSFYDPQDGAPNKTLLYFHGSGGGGPVTRGAIQTNRMAVNYPDADVVMSGHTHDNWIIPIKRQRIGQSGVPYQDLAYHVRTPTYKDEYDSGVGWAIEKGLNPKPLGCVWLEFYVADNTAGAIGVRVTADIE